MKKSAYIFCVLALLIPLSAHSKDCYLKDVKTGIYTCVDNKYPKHFDRKEPKDKKKGSVYSAYPAWLAFWLMSSSGGKAKR